MALLWLLWSCSCSETPVAPDPAPVVAPAKPSEGRQPSSEVHVSGDLSLQTTDLGVKCHTQGMHLFGNGWTIKAEGIDGPVEVVHQGRTFRSETGAKRWPQGYKFSVELPEVEGEGSIRVNATVDCAMQKGQGKPPAGTNPKR